MLREEALNLNKAIEMCRSSEITSKQLKTMEKEVKESGEELNFLRKSQAQHARGKRSQKFSKAPNKPVASNAVQCKYCGRRQRHSKKEECPAFGQQCNKCHQYNHFQKLCLSESVDFPEEVDGNSSDDSMLHIE